jgi:hypothetical protein
MGPWALESQTLRTRLYQRVNSTRWLAGQLQPPNTPIGNARRATRKMEIRGESESGSLRLYAVPKSSTGLADSNLSNRRNLNGLSDTAICPSHPLPHAGALPVPAKAIDTPNSKRTNEGARSARACVGGAWCMP